MSDSSSSSSSGAASSGPYTTLNQLPSRPFYINMPNPNTIPTNAEITQIFPDFVEVLHPGPDDIHAPPLPTSGFWYYAGKLVSFGELWILKQLGRIGIFDPWNQ